VHEACNDYDLCVPCFSEGSSSRDHRPATHSFSVIEQHSIPIFTDDWGADEELLLLEGAETYGLGSWADIADHIGGFRNKDEVREHYINIYLNSPHFPLPARADVKDTGLTDQIPREEFQARKKRRIEDRKDAAKNAPPSAPKQKPTASVPACHEVQGYMPGRLEFETEHLNDAEEAVQHMQFEPGDGINSTTGEMDPEVQLKLAVMDIYNHKLTQRAMRKRAIFEHNLLEYRKNAAIDKKRTKEERELFGKAKPLARVGNHSEFSAVQQSLEYEHNLRQAIAQLQDWRTHSVGDLKTGEKYEGEKATRLARPTGTGQLDRLPGVKPPKPSQPPETPAGQAQLTAPELPERLKMAIRPASEKDKDKDKRKDGAAKPNGVTANGTKHDRAAYAPAPIPGLAPLKLAPEGSVADLQLLSAEEKELCSVIRTAPKAYLAMKESILREATKAGGSLKRKQVREMCKVSRDPINDGAISNNLLDRCKQGQSIV
jgi:transcriptional adapter 2-alpha